MSFHGHGMPSRSPISCAVQWPSARPARVPPLFMFGMTVSDQNLVRRPGRMASPAAPSPSLSPGFTFPPSTSAAQSQELRLCSLSDYDLIVLAAREPEAAQAALASRDRIGIPSPNSVRNAVALGVAGAARGPSVVREVDRLRAQQRLPSASHSRRENESYRAAVVAEQVADMALTHAAAAISHL